MRSSLRIATLVIIAALAPSIVLAQSEQSTPAQSPVSNEASAAAPVAAPAGPRIETSSVAFQPATDSSALDLQPSKASQNLGQARAMMIVGGAAVVVGIVIGDDVGTLIAVSGAIIGLYGLYQYLK